MSLGRFLTGAVLAGVLVFVGCGPSSNDGTGGTGSDLISPTTVSGTVTCRNFTVASGQTTTVTSDLVLTASGNVTIEGTLVAADAISGDGYNITIIATGDIDVSGTIQAGEPAETPASTTARTIAENGQTSGGTAGEDGASINLKSTNGNVALRYGATLFATDGTNGSDGIMGGSGGKGGSISLCTTKTLTVRGTLWLGNGGIGGDAILTLDDLPNIFAIAGITEQVFGNVGGDSGFLYATAATYSWPQLQVTGGVHALDANAYILDSSTGTVSGGIGGVAGSVLIMDPATKLADQIANLRAGTDTSGTTAPATGITEVTAARGGHGWLYGGAGGIIAATALQWSGKDGLGMSVTGGKGGNVTSRSDASSECGNGVVAIGATGGQGGMANVAGTGGIPVVWAGGDPNGGQGGSAYAYAGAGGDAETSVSQIGGQGGQAFAIGGGGGDGRSSCYSPGDGGEGGFAEAKGGKGGDGAQPGEGGSADATGGTGGDGGYGESDAGTGGDGGIEFAKYGAYGSTGQAGEVIDLGIEFPGQGTNGQPGQTNYYVSPDYCASVDYECPDGQLCGYTP